MVIGYKTAISRHKPSAPMKYLYSQKLFKGKVLDYGCGKGFDANYYKLDRYDPYYYPTAASWFKPGKYNTITCNYVLNVVSPDEIPRILQSIKALLAPKGTAYITVRRDLKEDAVKGKDCLQYQVYLDLPVVKEVKGCYCIYKLENK